MWRRGFSREEQPAVDRGCQHGALAGMAGQGVRVGAAGERVVGPARFAERFQLAAEVVAEEGDDLVDAVRGDGAVAGVREVLRKNDAPETLASGLAARKDVVGAHLGAHGGAAQIAFLRQRLGFGERQGHLVGEAERQAARGIELVR